MEGGGTTDTEASGDQSAPSGDVCGTGEGEQCNEGRGVEGITIYEAQEADVGSGNNSKTTGGW